MHSKSPLWHFHKFQVIKNKKKSAEEVTRLSDKDQGDKLLENGAKDTDKKEPIIIPLKSYKQTIPFPQRCA